MPEAEPHRELHDKQLGKISGLDALFSGTAPDEAKQGFYTASTQLWESIKVFTVETLPGAITEGPFIAGAVPGVDDYHVGAWIARIAFVSGAQKSDDGIVALEQRFDRVPEKVQAYWKAWIVRESWKKTYADGVLH